MRKLEALIPNHTTRELIKTYEITAKHRFFTLIFGDTGRGKTLSAQHWTENNQAVYVRCKTKCTMPKLAKLIAAAMLGKAYAGSEQNERAIIDYLQSNDTATLILDEVNHILDLPPEKAKDSLNFIRDIYDTSKAGIVLITTSYDLNYLRHSALSKFLEQFDGRMGYNVQIPGRILKKSDILPILQKYVANPSESLLEKAAEIAIDGSGKIRSLVKYLNLARDYCSVHGETINPDLLDALRKRYEGGGEWPED